MEIIESSSPGRRKVWIAATKFENMSKRKFETHSILSCTVLVDCLLKVFSIIRCWTVIMLNLSLTFWKHRDLLSYFSYILPLSTSFDKNDWYCVIIIIPHFLKRKFWISKNILTQISVTSNNMRLQRTFDWNSCGKNVCQQVEVLCLK